MMGRSNKRLRRGTWGEERGTSALEVALVIPVFLMLIFGALDFGLAIVLNNVTSEAARDGARAGQVMIMQGHTSLSATDISNIQTAASAVTTPLSGLGTNITVTPTTVQDANSNLYLQVAVAANYTPVLGRFLGRIGTVNVGATSKLAVPCGMC